MISSIEVRNAQGGLLTLTLDDPSTGFLIEDIGGLGPVKANLVSSGFAGVDGEEYQSGRREARDIVFKINLEPDYVTQSVFSLRQTLYDFFMPKEEVFLTFNLTSGGASEVTINGRTETFDPDIFTAEPSVTISVRCFKPNFLDPTLVTVNDNTVSTTVNTALVYPGSVETGFEFTLNVNRTLTEFSIYSTPPDGRLRTLDFAAALQDLDVLKISTVSGSKGVWLTRAGIETSLLYAISPQSDWVTLFKGTNSLRAYAVGAAIPYTIKYTSKYGGL